MQIITWNGKEKTLVRLNTFAFLMDRLISGLAGLSTVSWISVNGKVFSRSSSCFWIRSRLWTRR